MKEKIARSYWRSIRRGTRVFADIPDAEVKALVRELAEAEGNAGTLTAEQAAAYIAET